MLPELGQVLLVLALLVALLQSVLPLAGAQRGNAAWMAVARPAASVRRAKRGDASWFACPTTSWMTSGSGV